MSETTNFHSRIRQVEAIQHGTVIDHIPGHLTLQVATLLASPDDHLLIGVNFRSKTLGRKGVVKITGRELPDSVVSRLALIAPDVTLSIIRDYEVVRKETIQTPSVFEGIARCPNPNCITNHDSCTTKFSVLEKKPLKVQCRYCERVFPGTELKLV
jgi:aspartate carbamoyltransferase regulatory subunit